MIVPMYVALCDARCGTQTERAYPTRGELKAALVDEGWSFSVQGGQRCPHCSGRRS